MRQAMSTYSPLGGVEFGAEIAEAMDLYQATQADSSLKHFLDQLQQAFSSFYPLL